MSNSRKDYKLYLLDIVASSKRIIKYTKSVSETDFYNNQMLIDAVIRNFEIIGEASNKIPKVIQKDIDLPWKEMVEIRNKIIHEYFDVRVDVIWKTAKTDIVKLNKQLKLVLKELGSKQLKLKINK